jgi:hypothetical protein
MANICDSCISVIGLKESPETFAKSLVGLADWRFRDLKPEKGFVGGVEICRFAVAEKFVPFAQVSMASENFPELLFHVSWSDEHGLGSGEFVFQNGHLLERRTNGPGISPYEFDDLKYFPSLLRKYMSLSFAQRGLATVEEALERIRAVHSTLHSRYRDHSGCDEAKVAEATKTIDDLLVHMEAATKSLTFESVFLPDTPMEKDESEKRWNTIAV